MKAAAVFARNVQLRHLRCLVAVAQERHLARAAERLALSQPAMSKTLAELEELAGTRLVERSSTGRRGVQGLTAAGEQLLAHALRVLEAVEASAQAVAPVSGERLERLRIDALPSLAASLLPRAVAPVPLAQAAIKPIANGTSPGSRAAARNPHTPRRPAAARRAGSPTSCGRGIP